MELFVTFGVVLAFTIPVLFMLLSITSISYEDTNKAQADAASRTLADTIDATYAQGPGAERQILLNVPVTTQEVYASNGEVIVRIGTSSGDFEAVAPTFAKIDGMQSLGSSGGLFLITVYINNHGEVELSR